jgi:transcriptional regulator with XRE-family HTH domain
MDAFEKKIRNFAEEKNLNLSQVADIVGISHTAIYRYINKQIFPGRHVVKSLQKLIPDLELGDIYDR